MDKKPKFVSLLISDVLALNGFGALLLIGLGIGLYFSDVTVDNQAAVYICYGFVFFGLLMVYGFFRRLSRLNKLFANGVEVKGVINSVYLFRGRGLVDFTFAYENLEYKTADPIIRTKRTSNFFEGKEITVIVNKDNPKKSIVKDVYFD